MAPFSAAKLLALMSLCRSGNHCSGRQAKTRTFGSLATAVERLGQFARVHSMLYGRTLDQRVVDIGHYLKGF